jgi:hypothetical protein
MVQRRYGQITRNHSRNWRHRFSQQSVSQPDPAFEWGIGIWHGGDLRFNTNFGVHRIPQPIRWKQVAEGCRKKTYSPLCITSVPSFSRQIDIIRFSDANSCQSGNPPLTGNQTQTQTQTETVPPQPLTSPITGLACKYHLRSNSGSNGLVAKECHRFLVAGPFKLAENIASTSFVLDRSRERLP